WSVTGVQTCALPIYRSASRLRGTDTRPPLQAGLCLSSNGGRVSVPRRREADLSVYERGGRQDAASLLDHGMPALPIEISVYDGKIGRASGRGRGWRS